MKKIKILYLIVILFFIGCSVHKPVVSTSSNDISQNPITRIDFGSGGGFSGNSTTYTIYPDGTFVSNDMSTQHIEKDTIESIFNQANIGYKSYVNPGNNYLFVRIYQNEEFTYFAWELGDKRVPSEILNLYTKLNILL